MAVHECSRIVGYKNLHPGASAEEIAGAYPFIGLKKVQEVLKKYNSSNSSIKGVH